jgi:hypothetical protein
MGGKKGLLMDAVRISPPRVNINLAKKKSIFHIPPFSWYKKMVGVLYCLTKGKNHTIECGMKMWGSVVSEN